MRGSDSNPDRCWIRYSLVYSKNIGGVLMGSVTYLWITRTVHQIRLKKRLIIYNGDTFDQFFLINGCLFGDGSAY